MNELGRVIDAVDCGELFARADRAGEEEVRSVLAKEHLDIRDLATLLSPAADGLLEEIARASSHLTAQRFGRTILLYAPVYLSNECVNICAYCGFRRDLDVRRVTLGPDEMEREFRFIAAEGFRHILLVTGEHRKAVPVSYLEDAVRLARTIFPSVSIEVEPFRTTDYSRLIEAGIDGVTLYQETYDRDRYTDYHMKGPKRWYDHRLEAVGNAAEAGVRRVGIGPLLGLADWREEALRTAVHARWLMKNYWKTHVSVSFPRIRSAAAGFEPPFPVSDREMTRMICALRLFLPDAGLVLSTRERPRFRDGLARLGITQMSAGSRTEPGGYHDPDVAEKQFDVDDARTPAAVAARLVELGLDPVWKDWEEALHG